VERSGGGRIDVFGAIAKLGATLMFQPLDKLLGAFLPGDEVGVLITTKRPLPVQRFTGAHELGHLYMRHEPSLDDENILRRAPFSTGGRLTKPSGARSRRIRFDVPDTRLAACIES
jgi:hypothetical protein